MTLTLTLTLTLTVTLTLTLIPDALKVVFRNCTRMSMVMNVALKHVAAGDGMSAFSSKATPGSKAAEEEAGRGLADTLGFHYLGRHRPSIGFSKPEWTSKVTTQVGLI